MLQLKQLIQCVSCALFLLSASVTANNAFNTIEWKDLIPQADLDILLNPPAAIQNISDGSAEDTLPAKKLATQNNIVSTSATEDAVERAIREAYKERSPEEQAYYAALESTAIKPEYDQQQVQIAGFVVPIQYNEQQVITEFFLVPYFGACIHLPPPPPNQIIHVTFKEGLEVENLYTPFWVKGKLATTLIENDVAVSAYSMSAKGVEIYQE